MAVQFNMGKNMHKFTTAILVIATITANAHAQSWAEQQQNYHERKSMQVEQFQQREEMEQRAIDERRHELERQRQEQLDGMQHDQPHYYRY